MLEQYHRAIVDEQHTELLARVDEDGWSDLFIERRESVFFIGVRIKTPELYNYLIRIDMNRYPVDPYWIGFLNPDLPRDRWELASDSDPRFWPWSPIPGLHGSFNITFARPIRTFWCRECNAPFFLYHGNDYQWIPRKWHLERVVAHLRDAIAQAEPPSRWRKIQRAAILNAATQLGISLPSDAGLGAK